ncbi:AMP-binding protein [Anaerostipes sp.]|uniref:AMP-binding protein n=1 Tax=Anaerostipes sp. TaxID=1872530 RepID=UPI0025BCBB90|nr:AMP-binding protein [Anaerostipes sp.]MBS7009884.1 AMP-binding protein [Anaerostipes sp.]
MCFFEQRKQRRDQPFLIEDQGRTVSYGQLDEFCSQFSQAVKERKLAFLLCENTAGSVMGYIACLRQRVVPLLLDAKMDEELLRNLFAAYDPDYLYVPDREERGDLQEGSRTVLRRYGYRLFERSPQKETRLNPELALLLTTSGSTGSPKLVRQSYANISANALSIKTYLDLDEKERPVTTLPMNYTYGLSVINSHMEAGASILLTSRTLFEKEFWDFFRREKGTSISGVPFTYEMLLKLGFMEMDLPFLKTMTQAGGKLSADLQRRFAAYAEKTGRKFIVMYGQTEATARMSYLPFEYAGEKIGSIGTAIPGGTFFLMEEAGGRAKEISEPEKEGELFYKGPNVTLGYAQEKKDLEYGDERNGCLATGDIAKRDRDGFYYITGRKKRFLKILGNRVNLDEAEQILKAYFPETEIACSGQDDRMDVYIAGEKSESGRQTAAFLSKKFHLNSSVFHIHYISEMPKNSSGKILYQELKKVYAGKEDPC